MKAIVTGGNGFIGSHLVDRLIKDNWEVIVIDDNSAECNDKFYYNEKAKNYKISICDYEKILPLFENINVVFHLAAESRIQPAILNPCYAASVNVVGTCNILQAAREFNVDRVIYSSTSAGYGLKNSLPSVESMANDCLNPYSVTKCAGEDLCSMYTKLFGLNTITFRYFNVYGDRQPTAGQYAPVVGLFLKQFLNNSPITIVGDGQQKRDFINVYDVVDANMAAALTKNKMAFGEIYNVGTGDNYSILSIAEKIGGDHLFLPPRSGEANMTLANIEKIKKSLNWSPKIDFMEWLDNELSKTIYKSKKS